MDCQVMGEILGKTKQTIGNHKREYLKVKATTVVCVLLHSMFVELL